MKQAQLSIRRCSWCHNTANNRRDSSSYDAFSQQIMIIDHIWIAPAQSHYYGWFSQQGSMSPWVRCSATSIGCGVRIEFKLAVLTYRCLHSMAPPYLADELHKVADIDSRRRLRSASMSTLVVPPTRHSTIGDRAFPVAASHVWNSLPSSVTSSTSLSAFRRHLKTELLSRCFGLDSVWNCCSM